MRDSPVLQWARMRWLLLLALGDRARAANPDRAEGHYYAAVGYGVHVQDLGAFAALRAGAKGNYDERMTQALKLDGSVERGGPWVAQAAYFYMLPWPLRDLPAARRLCKLTLAKYPENLRAYLILGKVLRKDGDEAGARAALQKALDGDAAAYDLEDAALVKREAKALLAP